MTQTGATEDWVVLLTRTDEDGRTTTFTVLDFTSQAEAEAALPLWLEKSRVKGWGYTAGSVKRRAEVERR